MLLVNSLYNIFNQIFIGWALMSFLIFIAPILNLFGSTYVHHSYTLDYGYTIGIDKCVEIISELY